MSSTMPLQSSLGSLWASARPGFPFKHHCNQSDSSEDLLSCCSWCSVLVMNGFSNSRLSADSLFTFRFSESDYNRYVPATSVQQASL